MRNFHFPGRSMAFGRDAMVATSHPSASLVGIEILKRGGNAVDASIAIAATLCVVEPAMTGVGGDCFALLHHPQKGTIGLNASGRAPQAATTGWYADRGIKEIGVQTAHAVTVPGAVDGWAMLLRDHGTMSLGDVLAPAIAFAQEGFAVAPRVAWDWARFEQKIRRFAGREAHLLFDDRAPRVGEVMRFPALAQTLGAIARDGRDAFYRGWIAHDIVKTLSAHGGLHTLDDFAAQSSHYVDPISASYGGLDIYELPPSNQGITALIMLNMLQHVPAFREFGDGSGTRTAGQFHILMEAARLAYAARDTFVADPDQAPVPVDHMLSDGFAATLARRIDPHHRVDDLGPIPRPKSFDTVTFCVRDASGMMISFINSLFSGFGTGIVARQSGVTLHNRGCGFTLDPRHPNHIAPRKRPLHTLVPALALKNGKPYMALGVMGAAFQPIGHVLVITGLLDHGQDAQEALDAPRIFFEDGRLGLEQSVSTEIAAGLVARGHQITRCALPWGGGQIVIRDDVNRTVLGASDPRKDGVALGY